jgi:hypothetical protein
MRVDLAFAAFTSLNVQLFLWVGTAPPFGVGQRRFDQKTYNGLF